MLCLSRKRFGNKEGLQKHRPSIEFANRRIAGLSDRGRNSFADIATEEFARSRML